MCRRKKMRRERETGILLWVTKLFRPHFFFSLFVVVLILLLLLLRPPERVWGEIHDNLLVKMKMNDQKKCLPHPLLLLHIHSIHFNSYTNDFIVIAIWPTHGLWKCVFHSPFLIIRTKQNKIKLSFIRYSIRTERQMAYDVYVITYNKISMLIDCVTYLS